ncbi:MAG TPA: 4-hydroxy-tetrahydrodipicolinate synthase [Bacteroidales bacterium]|nr:4-hydroxy-tetrahydrodipicolinate synthase [Bacteroidales bacterium]HPS17155.1 4-hydroxy-tetrahydrodipicolinate synthase [Bacteroidales bacterium]
MLKGAYTLLITPFKKDLSLDEEGLKRLVEMQVESGIHGIAPLGVTGENTMMTDNEIYKVVEIIAKHAKGKAKIVPDACSTSLWEAKERVQRFIDLGADYISVFTPYFVLPKQEGLIDFYEKLADFSKVPIVLHNAPERTGVDLLPETTGHLSKHPNISGIKDGNKKLDHLAKILYLTKDQDFDVFTGKDTTAYPLISFGGAGTFTVAGNAIPKVMKELTEAALSGNMKKAEQMHFEYYELFEAFRFESNPMAAKMALNLMGLPAGGHRSPLTPLSEGKTKILKSLMIQKGLIKE